MITIKDCEMNRIVTLKSRNAIKQINQAKISLPTVVPDDPKAPFSIATTPRFRGECLSFP